ncbi:MAG: hypothetical protein FWC42_10175 [Proteobacteria bacterium]|nr:hypothetical protein [Pseudomonadota bacterium]
MSGRNIKKRAYSVRLGMERPWRALRIPYRLFENAYDSDDLGDLLIAALRAVSDHSDQYNYRFDEDHTHQNPWYHVMIFEIEGIPEVIYEKFVRKVVALGFIDVEQAEDWQ